MTEQDNRYIDYRDLRHYTVIIVYWLILLVSTIFGVGIGAALLMATSLPASLAVVGAGGGGVFALVAAIEGFAGAVVGGALILFAGAIIVPLAATFAGVLHSYFSSRYVTALFVLSEPTPHDHLGERVIALSERLKMKAPGVSTMEDVVNAFAMGGVSNGIISIGRPLIDNLTKDELDAIIGHELGHIANMDTTRTIFGRSFQHWLSFFLVFHGLQKFVRWVVTPIGEMLLLYNSRHREYFADAIGAFLTSKESMISALQRLEKIDAPKTKTETRYADLMFNGFSRGLLRTHPKTVDRIRALEEEIYIKRLPIRQYLQAVQNADLVTGSDPYTSGI